MSSVNNRTPVVLNFDDSAGDPDDAVRVDLTSWQEIIRFGCKLKEFGELRTHLNQHVHS